MALIESLLRVAGSQQADGMVLEAGKPPSLLRRGEKIPLAMPPLGAELLAQVIRELLADDEKSTLERDGTVEARNPANGFVARIDSGASGVRLSLRKVASVGPAAASGSAAASPVTAPASATGVAEPPPPALVPMVASAAVEQVIRATHPLGALLALAAARAASDVFVSAHRSPMVRVDGELVELAEVDLPFGALVELLDERSVALLQATGSADLALDWTDGENARRVRLNVFRHADGLAASLRLVDERALSLAELGLPAELAALARHRSGMVLIAGLAGAGKSTTLGALVDALDVVAARHVITLEDPIERRYPTRRGLIHQREIGRDVESFAAGLRAAVRESPDVIVLGEMRDPETISAALTAAETGHLVLSTVHAAGPATAVDRIIDAFPASRAQATRSQLAAVLRAVVGQRLLVGRAGGRVPAIELLNVTSAVGALIRDDRGHQLATAIQTGKADGMITLEASLARLVTGGKLTREIAAGAANDREQLRALLGR